jgi:hypothetical protein
MTGVYRKWGRVIRYENGVTIRVEEAGEAIEGDGVFRAAPMAPGAGTCRAQLRWAEPPSSLPTAQGDSAQRSWALQVPAPCTVERLIITAGVARHETNGVTWTEESHRVHISLINPPLRALIDLASFDFDFVQTIGVALARAEPEREAPPRVRLAPNVAAVLLPSLIGELAMEQTGGGFDGRGQRVETRAVTADPPPNWYRPGYAVQPVRAWLNIRALPFGSIDKRAPLAIALLGPAEGMMLRVLCDDGEAIFPTTIEACRIAAISRDEPTWYPYAAGSFGVEMML